jgi:23S rRNA (cytosine1962-C5)-methyltransferase
VLQFQVDALGGQKTGFYLDQRENRLAMRRYMRAPRVLDLFASSGGFALHARHAGAETVVAVDTSEPALEVARTNARLNDLDGITFRSADAFVELREVAARGEKFDVIVLDPPPFARSKKHVSAARKRYVELLTLSLAVLAADGVLFYSSCSHHITQSTFHEIVREGLSRSGRRGVILEQRGASPDHPVHPFMPETGYLHAVILHVE